MYACGYLLCAWFLQRRVGRFPETGVMDSCEPSCVMDSKDQTWVLCPSKVLFSAESSLQNNLYHFLKKEFEGKYSKCKLLCSGCEKTP